MTPIFGRVVDKHLSDELDKDLAIAVDGIDGGAHHIAGIAPGGGGGVVAGYRNNHTIQLPARPLKERGRT